MECELIFGKLKDFLTLAPILAIPIEGEGFTIYCDALDVSLGCVLIRQGRVIGYALR